MENEVNKITYGKVQQKRDIKRNLTNNENRKSKK